MAVHAMGMDTMNREKRWAFLWLEYERVGYVECLSLFGLTLYRRCGQIIQILGIEWVEK